LTGDVTGTATFDGSAAVNIATTVGQAAEGTIGGAAVATQAQTDAGINDTTYITPKKLRWGFAASFGVNSYVVFPTWLGSLIIQFGSFTPTAASQAISFPLAFPTACRAAFVSQDALSNTSSIETAQLSTISKTGFIAYTNIIAGTFWWVAFGN
jgi:hypothetical protein